MHLAGHIDRLGRLITRGERHATQMMTDRGADSVPLVPTNFKAGGHLAFCGKLLQLLAGEHSRRPLITDLAALCYWHDR